MFCESNIKIRFSLMFAFLLQVHVHSAEHEFFYDDFEDGDVADWLGRCPDCCFGTVDPLGGDLVVQNTSGQNFIFRWGPVITGDATFHTRVKFDGHPQDSWIGMHVYMGAGDCGPAPTYAASLRSDGAFGIWRYDPPMEELAVNFMPQPFDATRDYHLQLDVREDELEFRIWPEGEDGGEAGESIVTCIDGRFRAGTLALAFNRMGAACQGVFRFARITVSEEGFRRGDCNDDGNVDISDAVFALGSLILGEDAPPCDDACDSNDDGAMDLSDAVYTLSWRFLGGSPPPVPGPSTCGPDETEEVLTCDSFASCN